jgi:uncharacterized membrane protein YqgA involved in biofilm formation
MHPEERGSEEMVDRTTITIMGLFVMAIGIGSGLMSRRLARTLTPNLHSRAQRNDRSAGSTGTRSPTVERFVRALILFGALGMTIVGAMWIAGIGTN